MNPPLRAVDIKKIPTRKIIPFSTSELLSVFSSPIKLTHEEVNLYNPEDLAALLALKPSIDIFSLGPFGQKRGFSNWGRVGKGDEILYNGIPRAPVYLNYPQSSEADLTPLQHETADSIYFFDHPLASFLSGTQSPTSAYLFNSEPDFAKPLVTLRLNKGITKANPFSSSLQSTFVFDAQRPLGKKAYARGVGSFKNRSRGNLADNSEVQSYHLFVQNSLESKNRWQTGYELDRELGAMIPFTGIPDSNLGKNFRRDAFFVRLDGQLSANTKIEADLRYQRTDQKILSTDSKLRRRAEERRPYFGLGLTRQKEKWMAKLYGNINATVLNQHPERETDWQVRMGGLWAVKLTRGTHFSTLAQVSDDRFNFPKLEGWAGISNNFRGYHTIFLTASSQVVYPSTFDLFFQPRNSPISGAPYSYVEFSQAGPPERTYGVNLTYKLATGKLTGGFSLFAGWANNYLFWENNALLPSFSPNGSWGPSYRDLQSGGGELSFEIKSWGKWRGGYALKYHEDPTTSPSLFARLPLAARHRAYLRWMTPEMRPLRTLSIRLVPMVHYFSGFKDDVIPYKEKEAFLVNLKAVGAVRGFNFYYAVENVLDRQYSLRGFRLQNGRTYYFGFNWTLWD